MAEQQLGTIPGRAQSARRMGDALLRLMGNGQVTLRVANPSSGDTDSQIGLEAPSSVDMPLSPVLVRPLKPLPDGRRRVEVVISSTLLNPIAKNYGVTDISAWLLTFEGVVWEDELLRITEVTVDKFLGADCFFHLTATK
jgi:hypothetical protein